MRKPPGWASETTGQSAKVPAYTTVASPAAKIGSPGTPAKSTPRCPGRQFGVGASKPRNTTAGGRNGHCNRVSSACAAAAPSSDQAASQDANQDAATVTRRT
ncbi:hypothetical protein MPSD_40130 [Mycobacterium pseudoshottsii JCM 15466]|nr:hypothetical protein MPSD_40130 [Mycobacterium pseudoshottsii JCM 15466]